MKSGKLFLPLAAACAAAWSQPALAGDEDTQLWLYGNIVAPLGTSATATLEISPRFRESTDQLLTRGTVDFKVAPGIALGGGAAYVEYAGGHELRTVQQFTASKGMLSAKTRVEERFFAGAPRMQLRLRQKLQLTAPVGAETKLIGAAELLYIARSETPQKNARVDSWRFTAAVQHAVSPHFDVALGYLFIVSPVPGGPDRYSHVPQLTLTARL